MRFAYGARLLLLAASTAGPAIQADEGMWPYSHVPREQIRERHGVALSDRFLDHLRLSSVRLSVGGSGSFVSPQGLLLTNHHLVSECIQRLSSGREDLMADGFYAASHEQERPCPQLEADVLTATEDVTALVTAEVPDGLPASMAQQRRRAAVGRLERQCPSGARCEVVSLFSGAVFHRYLYRRYVDLRLVLAPEASLALFGGDPDNFTFPRHALDFALFRAYEGGRPAKIPHHLAWSRDGLRTGGLTFTSGHPGYTGRLATVAQLELQRDVTFPLVRDRLALLVETLQRFSVATEENRRLAQDALFVAQNGRKAFDGYLAGLRDPRVMDAKRTEEAELRRRVRELGAAAADVATVWDEVAAAVQEFRRLQPEYFLFETGAGGSAQLPAYARLLHRYAEAIRLPTEQRPREFSDAALPGVRQKLLADVPVSQSLEATILSHYLTFLRDRLGPQDPTVRAILGTSSPEQAAARLIGGSVLYAASERKRLLDEPKRILESKDSLLALVRLLEPRAQRVRKLYEERVEAVLAGATSRLARARFLLNGESEYPDATFTLRLSYGLVKGYENRDGRFIEPVVTLEGLFRRATGREPYRLPAAWLTAKTRLSLGTPMNFVSTADTHAGNSGSPTVNEKGELVGVLYDGNAESLANRFLYTEERARAVHVTSQGIAEAIRHVYRAERLLKEIGLPTSDVLQP